MSRLLLPFASLLLVACAPAPARPFVASSSPASPSCVMSPADEAWITSALATWDVVAREILLLPAAPLPGITTFDARCAFTAAPRADGTLAWRGAPHDGRITLPDGNVVPPQVTSFAAPLGDGDEGFFVMSLPSVWRARGITSGLGLERLLDGVLLHELMHTRQFYFANPTLAELTRRYSLGDDIHDDALQERYERDSAYVAHYVAERDLLYAAAAAPDDHEARRLATRALEMLRGRRARWFVGDAAQWAPLDEIFLTMEGLGQWTAYAWLVSERGPRVDPAVARRELRRGGRRWSQDEGLALFLVIDRLLPGWQRQAFAAEPVTVEGLLARAVAE